MSSTTAPKKLGILLSHGALMQPSCFDPLKARLEAAGFSPIIAVQHPSIGTDPSVTSEDDARHIQAELAPFLDEGRVFLCVAHSYGGVPVVAAAKGFSVAEREARGLRGGIAAAVFIAAIVPTKKGTGPMSMLPGDLDLADVSVDGVLTGKPEAAAILCGPDMTEGEMEAVRATWQPQSAATVAGPVPLGMEDLTTPSYYVVCEKDRCVPAALQEEIAASAPLLKRVLRVPGGHASIVTQVDRLAEQIVEISAEVEKEEEVKA
ncbi:hypothetical protein CSOJ01_05802 [Colletotrichum sojae]|uniref:AB hydrolase-1 domain-containing protein n=1 Tax=Colletotrichum sojae TaxID=2175907 RepID=A0A8H6JDR5_9PEZI|nr:hypothetical protein CSOJ01_05802 [Colletotrichum sojae]